MRGRIRKNRTCLDFQSEKKQQENKTSRRYIEFSKKVTWALVRDFQRSFQEKYNCYFLPICQPHATALGSGVVNSNAYA